MCWSSGASAAFAVMDAMALGALCYRNRPRDRWYALGFSPIVGQELCQVGLWLHIGASASECDDRNVALSFLVRAVVNFVPLTFTLLAIRGADRLARRPERGQTLALALASLLVAARLGLMAFGFAAGPRLCTAAGPNHHQVWADLLAYALPGSSGLLLAVPYTVLPVLATLVYLRPRWVAGMVAGIACSSLAVSRLLLPVEWESVWCWAGCSFLVFALLEPHLGEVIERQARRRREASPAPSPVR